MRSLLAVLLAVLLVSCSLVACRSTPQGPVTPADAPVLLHLVKGTCNAKCPAWEAELRRSGELRFVGRLHTRTGGEAASKLDDATLSALVARLEALDTSAWPTKAAPLADGQEVALTLKGSTFRYVVGGDAPESLQAFVAELEGRLGVSEWVTGGAER